MDTVDTRSASVPEDGEKIIEIQLERLRTFRNHPFKVRMDQEMIRLSASVEKYGIINPLIVRPIPDGVYEIISGHRRKAAAEKFGYRKVPVIIRVMSDDEAVINMVDSNLQRQQITFSEKAFAYKMKNEAMKRTGGRRKSSQSDYPLKGKKTVEIIGEEFGDSAKQVQRYLKLTDLIPELLEKLDNGELSFNPAVELSYLTIEEQKEFIDAMEYTQAAPSISQSSLGRIMAQENLPSLITLEKICTALGVTLSQFFQEGNSENLTEKQKEVLRIWNNLSTNEQETVMSMLRGLRK